MKIRVIKTDNGYYGELVTVPENAYNVWFRKDEIKWKNIKKELVSSYA